MAKSKHQIRRSTSKQIAMALRLFTFRLTAVSVCLKSSRFKQFYLKHGNYHKLQKFCRFSSTPKTFEAANNESSSESDSDSDGEVPKDIADLKLQILKSGLNFVPEHGWSKKSIALGAQSIGLSTASQGLIEDGGADLVHYFNFLCNERLEEYLKERNSSNTEKQDIQNFIEDALSTRLRMVIPYISRWPEAMALMVSPVQAQTHAKHLLDLVDLIWHYTGDESVNLLWYSKRASLALVYRMCELSLVQDKSCDYVDTLDFLQRRVEDVMCTDQFMNEISDGCKDLPDFTTGALITIRNLLGTNRFR